MFDFQSQKPLPLESLTLRKSFVESVAQLVEQRPFKPWVEGSSPSRFTH